MVDVKLRDKFPHGWCLRCGVPYENAVSPRCECAGDPPLPGGHAPFEDFAKHRHRVAALRYVPR